MRPLFRWTALLVATATLGLWWHGGLDLGWTRTQVRQETVHPATGARTESWRPGFVPGIDFLAGGALAATLLMGGSFFCRRPGVESPSSPP